MLCKAKDADNCGEVKKEPSKKKCFSHQRILKSLNDFRKVGKALLIKH